MIEVRDVTRRYGTRTVLDQVTWTFPAGVRTHIHAPNGTGKTTLFKCLLGLEACRGTVLFSGRPLDAVRESVGVVFDEPIVYPRLTGAMNLALLGGIEPDQAILDALQLGPDLLARRAAGYSAGERKRLALGLCLSSRPRYILLDEVDAGLDEATRRVVAELIRQLSWSPTVLLAGHNPPFYELVADEMVGLSDGKLRRAS